MTKDQGPTPTCISTCVDCGLGTITAGEWYMVRDDVWEQAWCGRRKSVHGRVPGQEILCIGCLEARIGRTLMRDDFTALIGPGERCKARYASAQSTTLGEAGFFRFVAWRMIKRLPPPARERAWRSFIEKGIGEPV